MLKKGYLEHDGRSAKFREEMSYFYSNEVYNRSLKRNIITSKNDLDNLSNFFDRQYLKRYDEYTEYFENSINIITINSHGSFNLELVEAFANNFFYLLDIPKDARDSFIMSVGLNVTSNWSESFLYKCLKQFGFLGDAGI